MSSDAQEIQAVMLQPDEARLDDEVRMARPRKRHADILDDPARSWAHDQDMVGEE
jgi:hypothetical protein